MTFEELVREIRALPVEKRKELIGLIVDTLTQPDQPREPEKRNILEFEGIGEEIWQAVDTEDYINKLRIEWNDRA